MMFGSALIAIFIMTIIVALWLWVQLAWGATFADGDTDALAGRSCHGCENKHECERRKAAPTEEER